MKIFKLKTLFILLLSIFFTIPVIGADITLSLKIIHEQDKAYLNIKNDGKGVVKLDKTEYFFNNQNYETKIDISLNSNEEKRILLEFQKPTIKGSYNLAVRLFYYNENTRLSMLSGEIMDFGQPSRILLDFQAQADKILEQGKIVLLSKTNLDLNLMQPFFPAELFVRNKEISSNTIKLNLENKAYNFNNNYIVYFLYEKEEIINGMSIHSAGIYMTSISTGAYVKKTDKHADFFTIALIIVAFFVTILVILSYLAFYKKNNKSKGFVLLYSAIILVVGYITYFHNYHYPTSAFWDENYHIASAQKYLDGVFYMEPHPPLAKMIMALGESMISPNQAINTKGYLNTDYISNFPEGYSFLGMRFFPTLFAYLAAFAFFFIFYRISRNPHYSLLFSSFYLFENAFIVHSRAAMLDSIQMFFILITILYFLYLYDREKTPNHYLALGILAGFPIACKLNGLIMLLLIFFLLFFEYKDRIGEFFTKIQDDRKNSKKGKKIKEETKKISKIKSICLQLGITGLNGKLWKEFLHRGFYAVIGILIVVVISFYLHFAIGSKVVENRYYKASDEYKLLLDKNKTASPADFGIMMRDNLKYIKEYEKGVPKLDYCKQSGENGSNPLGWAVGHRSINYRWAKSDGKTNYTYLQGNPIIWFSAFFAVLLAFGFIVSRFVFGMQVRNPKYFNLASVFFVLYVSYMYSILRIDRVMYLYHYFVPLAFAIILVYIMFNSIFEEYLISYDRLMLVGTVIFVLTIFIVFLFFSPLTYNEPMTNAEFIHRSWLEIWGLKYVGY